MLAIVLAVYYSREDPRKHGGSGSGGRACNAWKAVQDPTAAYPSWAAEGPGCDPNDPHLYCRLPAVAVTKTGAACPGGAGTTPGAYGDVFGATCSAASAGGQVDDVASLYYLSRDPACGPWTATDDPSTASTFQGTPVCYPTGAPDGTIVAYDAGARACAPGNSSSTGWHMVGNDVVPGTGR